MGASGSKGSNQPGEIGATTTGMFQPKLIAALAADRQCDKVVRDVLTNCDFRGGIPKWKRGAPAEYHKVCNVQQALFKEQWDQNLQECTFFGREGDKLVTKSQLDPKQIASTLTLILNARESIRARLNQLGPDQQRLYAELLIYLDLLGSSANHIVYSFTNPKVDVHYRWFAKSELDRLLNELLAIQAILGKSKTVKKSTRKK